MITNNPLAFLCILLLAIVIVVIIARRVEPEPTDWHPYVRVFPHEVMLMDGTVVRERHLMRKQGPNGNWLYRKMTEEEWWRWISANSG
jgi:hypothetical protein